MYKSCCKDCGVELTFKNIRILRDVDLNKIGAYCKSCFEPKLQKLMSERFVEEYKYNSIYMKDNAFVPYWGCAYYFNNIEDVRARIDNNTVGYYPNPGELFELMK